MAEDIIPDLLNLKINRANMTSVEPSGLMLMHLSVLIHASLTYGMCVWRNRWTAYARTSAEHKVAAIYTIFAILIPLNGFHIFYFIDNDVVPDPTHIFQELVDGITITIYFLVFFITTCVIEIQYSLFEIDNGKGFTSYFLLSDIAFSSMATCAFVVSKFPINFCAAWMIFLAEYYMFFIVLKKFTIKEEVINPLDDDCKKSSLVLLILQIWIIQASIVIMVTAFLSILLLRSYMQMMKKQRGIVRKIERILKHYTY